MKWPALSLFWRTFLLILALLAASVLAWVQSLRVFEQAPRAHQLAQQIVSVVNLTRSALLYADPTLRRELLAELADNEGIRIVPRESNDEAALLSDPPFIELVYERIKQWLGPDTVMSGSVNGDRGVWISFSIAGDSYWVVFERERLSRNPGTQWVSWAIAALLLSLATAVAISRVVNQPLRRLSLAARELGAGRAPAPLPERGPSEIRTVNQNFNRMVTDLVNLEQDRTVLLAGISHDLRTPLTRLRLELEINDLPAAARDAMAGDVEQMDAIVRQFLDYARATPRQPRAAVDLSQLASEAVAQSRLAEQAGATLETAIEPGLVVNGHATELRRALDNLLVNANLYGRDPVTGALHLTVSLARRDDEAVLSMADQGPGVPAAEIDRLLRPFERGEAARGGGTGAGLGLAIVQRVAQLHQGHLVLAANVPSGLRAQLHLPVA